MQIIQGIRDRGAAITVGVIVLCLIGFVLMDAKQGSSRLFGSTAKGIGKVNGETIPLSEFNKRLDQTEAQDEQRSGQKPSGSKINQLREQVWNQLVAEKIFFAEANKLGINFTPAELSSVLLSSDQNNPFMQQQGMIDSASGKLDISKAQEAMRNIKKMKGEQKEAVNNEIINPLKLSSIVAKYSGLLAAAAYYPTWMQERDAAAAKNFAQISYVAIPYSEISDSAVVVKDEDITAYEKKHKTMFKQEAGRIISYLSFSQLPDKTDSNRVEKLVADLKPAFAADTNAKAFVAKNTSIIDFQDEFLPKSKIQSAQLDTIAKLPVGTVYGPYVDGGSYVLAKLIGSKQLPDSVRARHILIPTANPRTGEQINDDASAKKLADSILTAVKGGADFAALAAKYSSDGSKDKGGDVGTFAYGTMVPEFNEFSFTKPVGSIDVVKTQFGYHVMEITNQKDFKPAYKIAFLAKEISAGDETMRNASTAATKASAEKTGADLAKYAATNGLKLIQNPTPLKENDFTVGNMQEARTLVRWAFDAKKGAVSDPIPMGDDFIVATVEKILDEGLQDPQIARTSVEGTIRNEKKAEMIKAKLTATPTLESAAAAYKKQVQQVGADSTITFNAQIINGIGMEPKLLGAAFNPSYKSKPSPPIAGNSGVYVIKVTSVNAKAPETPEMIAQQAASRLSSIRSQTGNWYEGLKNQATIKDNRSTFF